MRYYYERDNVTEVYYIIDRYSDTHIADVFFMSKVEWLTKILNDFEERRVKE